MILTLAADDYELAIDPQRGGSIVSFAWRGQSVMRPSAGSTIFDVSCFPLVPFSNRIANGRFLAGGKEVQLKPNFPGSDHPHPLHGFGWLAEWDVTAIAGDSCTMMHRYAPSEWPWRYTARQSFVLGPHGVALTLSVENNADTPMPAGLGFHPYFVRDEDTVFQSLHRGQWRNMADCLPLELDQRDVATDWWQGAPVGSRIVDTVYTNRSGPLTITWPSRRLGLAMRPSENLGHTVVFTPRGEDYFCVEPVNHVTDAVNAGTMPVVSPGATASASLNLVVRSLS